MNTVQESLVIYFDTNNGNDSAKGTKDYPVKTFNKAYSLAPRYCKQSCSIVKINCNKQYNPFIR